MALYQYEDAVSRVLKLYMKLAFVILSEHGDARTACGDPSSACSARTERIGRTKGRRAMLGAKAEDGTTPPSSASRGIGGRHLPLAQGRFERAYAPYCAVVERLAPPADPRSRSVYGAIRGSLPTRERPSAPVGATFVSPAVPRELRRAMPGATGKILRLRSAQNDRNRLCLTSKTAPPGRERRFSNVLILV